MKIKNMIIVCLFLFPGILLSERWRSFTLYKNYYYTYRESLFNPKNRSVEALKYTNGPFGSLFQHLSLQTELFSLQWQIDVMGSLKYENERWNDDININQCYFQKNISPYLMLLAGRTILHWGTGYSFNPTDVVAPDKELSDPENREKRTAGNDLIKLEYFGETYSLALCYLTRINIESSITTRGSRLAFRFYKNIHNMDISFIGCIDKEESPVWGINFSSVIGERLEIHGEVSTQRGSYRRYHRTIQQGNILFQENPFTDFRRNNPHYYHSYLLGFQYTLPKNILWIAEYYHQDQGYTREEWNRIIEHVQFINSQLKSPFEELAEGNLLWSLNLFSARGTMRDYLMNYIQIPVDTRLGLRSTWLLNLDDFSSVFIPELNIQIGNHFTFYGRSYIFQGRKKTEFGELFQSCCIEGGIRVK